MNKNKSKILNRYESIEEEIPVLYMPGVFWEDASKKILNEIENHGIENFRRLKLLLTILSQPMVYLEIVLITK